MNSDTRLSILTLETIAHLNTRNIAIMTTIAGSGHLGGSLSINRIITYLEYAKAVGLPSFFDPDNDIYIISKAHAAPAKYAIDYLKRRINNIFDLRELGSMLQGHLSKRFYPYVLTTGGPLGHGISVMNGIAFSDKKNGKERNRVVIVGDGELNEGQNWEAFMTIAHHELPVKVFVDYNKMQLDGFAKNIKNLDKPVSLAQKLAGFFNKVEEVNGNDIFYINQMLSKIKDSKPEAIIFHTTKGYGIKETENNPLYHGSVLSLEKLEVALNEIDEKIKKIVTENPKVEEILKDIDIRLEERVSFEQAVIEKRNREKKNKKLFITKTSSQRDKFGETIKELGHHYPNLYVLDADTSLSTKSVIFEKDDKLKERFINFGIAEADMLGTAAGLALEGNIVVCAGFSVFLVLKGLDQIRQDIASQHLPVYIQATHRGLTVGEDGESHQMLEDLAIMSSIPNMNVLCFSTANQEAAALRKIIKGINAKLKFYSNPFYAAVHRVDVPELYSEDYEWFLSRNNILCFDPRDEIMIYSTGVATHFALEIYEKLKKENIYVRVIDVSTIKPFSISADEFYNSEKIKVISTLEDGVTRGLGAAFNQEYVKHPRKIPVINIGVETFGESGTPLELVEKYGLKGKLLENLILACYENKNLRYMSKV